MLQPDMTWQLTPSEDIAENLALLEGLEAFHQGFVAWLDRDGTLGDHLPFQVRRLPYYRRLLAAGVAGSLKRSRTKSGLEDRQSREWLSVEELPRLNAWRRGCSRPSGAAR